MKDTRVTAPTQDQYLRAIWKVLSQERLEGGYGGSANTRQDILANYLWNMALCEALYPSLQALEVALRNTVFDAGAAVYPFRGGRGEDHGSCWLDSEPPVLHVDEVGKVAAAKRHLADMNKPLEPGRLVAELQFGFWTALFDVRYENTRILWPRLFGERIFGGAPKNMRSRKKLSPLLNRIRHLRNRAFHHKPIWHWRDLPDQHAMALDLIGWMSPPLRSTVEAMDRFAAIHTAGAVPFRSLVTSVGSPTGTAQ